MGIWPLIFSFSYPALSWGYAYDGRWNRLTIGGFFRRRFERLPPLVVLGMTLGGIGFYFTDSTLWPLIHTVPVWKLIAVMLIGYTLLPIPLSMDIRGWQEMHPLNSVGWFLFFEYIANILYMLGLRKLPHKALACFVAYWQGQCFCILRLLIPTETLSVAGHSMRNTCASG